MRLLADENVDSAVVDWLRSQAIDVLYVAEFAPATADNDVLRISWNDRRVLLPADLDFGDMVFRQRRLASGVILLRYRTGTQLARLELFCEHWQRIAQRIEGNFIVATNRKVRIRPLPD